MVSRYISKLRTLAVVAAMLAGSSAWAQTTANGTINGKLVNANGISIVFNTDAAGVTLGASGTSAASANFGNISAFGPLSAGVTRPTVTAGSYTVQTVFDVEVIQGGLNSTTYTLRAQLAGAAPTGLSYRIDAVNLGAALQILQNNGAYDVNVAHNLDLVVSTAAPGAGGPAVGTPLSTTINLTATAN